MSSIFTVIALGVVVNLVVTALGRAVAPKLGLMDAPDGRRKLQTRPIAVVGGLCLFFSSVITLVLAQWFSFELREALRGEGLRIIWLLMACAITIVVGAFDDRFNLRARYKLAGQITAVLTLIFGGGYLIQQVSVFGYPIEFGIFAVPVTMLWFLAAINAINLLDGMDGLLGTLGIIICASLGVMAFVKGAEMSAYVAFTIVGCLLGFLAFNRPPATVYLGDAGSMVIGLVIASLSLQSSLKAPAVCIVAPAALLILPFLDTSAAIIRRKLTGRGLAISDRAHLHHLLQKKGFTIRQSLVIVGALGIVAGIGAIFSASMQNDFIAIGAAVAVVLILLVCGLFGMAETQLVVSRFRSVFSSAMTRSQTVEMEVRLQGTAEWDEVWGEITNRATELRLTTVHLDVNAPAWQEGYHRRWVSRAHKSENLTLWRVEVPLMGHGQVIGRLIVFGDRGTDCIGEKLSSLSDLAKKVEFLATAATLPMAESSAKHQPIVLPVVGTSPEPSQSAA